MEKYRIFDDGGKSIDRYTLINTDNDMFGFNEEPFHPQGFGQYCCDWKGGSTRHLGKKISIEALSENARKFVIERI